jgi:hypothetical protein
VNSSLKVTVQSRQLMGDPMFRCPLAAAEAEQHTDAQLRSVSITDSDPLGRIVITGILYIWATPGRRRGRAAHPRTAQVGRPLQGARGLSPH